MGIKRLFASLSRTRIRKAAARWLIRLQTAERIEDHWPAFEQWLRKPQHRAAFERMERAWRAVNDLKVLRYHRGSR